MKKIKYKYSDSRKIKIRIVLFFLIGMIVPSFGIAVDTSARELVPCTYNATYDCEDCKAPILVHCSLGISAGMIANQGFVSRQAKLDKLTVLVTDENGYQRRVVLSNPPGQLSDYIDNIGNNKWVKDRVKDLKFGDKVEVAQGGYALKSDKGVH